VVKDRQVFWRVAGADAGLVLVHGDIEDSRQSQSPVNLRASGTSAARGICRRERLRLFGFLDERFANT
jgi:hypothetical protein